MSEPNIETAIEKIIEAYRFINLCSAACESSYLNSQREIKLTLGLDVSNALSEALEALGVEPPGY